ncbi:MAG: hypothetical protein ACI9F2_000417 [Lysobacterales bacterium]|jgi:hypothetical protein
MDKDKIIQFIQKKSRFDFIGLILGCVLIIVSITGYVWIAKDTQRTIFFGKNILIEQKIAEKNSVIEKFTPSNEKEEELKKTCQLFSELTSGHNLMVRMLLDLGFLSFLFWSGLSCLVVTLSFTKYRKKLKKLLNE